MYVCVFLCLFLFFLSVLFLLFLALALSFFSLLSSLLFSLPLFLLSSLLATAANFEAFECDMAHGKCTAVGSLPPPLSSLLLSLPPLLKKKKRRELFITGIFPARNLIFITVLNLFQKKQRIKTVIISAQMVHRLKLCFSSQ